VLGTTTGTGEVVILRSECSRRNGSWTAHQPSPSPPPLRVTEPSWVGTYLPHFTFYLPFKRSGTSVFTFHCKSIDYLCIFSTT
jgi:hypothetical protein